MKHGDLYESGFVEEHGYAAARFIESWMEPERCFLEEDVMSAYMVKILYEQGQMGLQCLSDRTVEMLREIFTEDSISPSDPVVLGRFLYMMGMLRDQFCMLCRVEDTQSYDFSLTEAGEAIWEVYNQKILDYHKMSDRRTFMK